MAETREVLLRMRGVKTWYPVRKGLFKTQVGNVKAVDGVDLDIYRGEIIGLVGESGCGKTTLGKSLLQLVRPTSGTMEYAFKDGTRDLRKLSRRELDLARKTLQIVFQDPYSSLNPAFTIFGSLEEPLKKFGVRKKADREKIIGDLLVSVNMQREHLSRYPNEFSGGQRQRIGIARALSVDPELIVCDEAVSALDVSIQAQVLQLLLRLKEEKNLTYIFITHNLSVVEYISDRIAVMYLGRIVELSATEQLFANTLHPYTKALLAAIPVADLARRHRRSPLQGDVPSPVDPPSGCPFHPRCPECRELCKVEVPEFKKYLIEGKEHFCSCHVVAERLG
jgi:oligopeptide/dipeptide ABC transporter ATP-binding protein